MSEKIEKIINSFDLAFSDMYKDENVRQLTLEEKLDVLEKATELMVFEEAMNFSIFNKRGEKFPTAEIYAIDFPSDYRASVYLLLGGYYRQAVLCLRNWLEVRLTGIYFSFVNPDNTTYQEWKQGKRRIPIVQGLVKQLFARHEFRKIDDTIGLRLQLNTLMSDLSAFTHCSGLEKYGLQDKTDNVPRFNPQSVDIWFNFTLQVFAGIVICYFAAYGCDAFVMTTDELRTLHYLPENYQKELQKNGIPKQTPL